MGRLEIVRKHLRCTSGLSYTNQKSGAIPHGECRCAIPSPRDNEPPLRLEKKKRRLEREKGRTGYSSIRGLTPPRFWFGRQKQPAVQRTEVAIGHPVPPPQNGTPRDGPL